MNNEKNLLISKRYAQSLIDLGKEEKLSFVSISSNLANIVTILSHSTDLFDALTNPLISIENKTQIIDSVFEKDTDELIRNFLKLLVEKNRFNMINEIINIFYKLLDEINNVTRIEVVSAVELNVVEKSQIQDKLNEKLQKQVSIKYNIDESIIAGLVLKMEDDIIDMSVSRKLENLKKAIIK